MRSIPSMRTNMGPPGETPVKRAGDISLLHSTLPVVSPSFNLFFCLFLSYLYLPRVLYFESSIRLVTRSGQNPHLTHISSCKLFKLLGGIFLRSTRSTRSSGPLTSNGKPWANTISISNITACLK